MAKEKRAKKILSFKQSEFVPFAAYYNAETIISKNGELMQVIKVDTSDFHPITNDGLELRDIIRDTIFQALPDDSYSFWFTTIRRKKSFELPENFPTEFPKMVDRQWSNTNNFKRQFSNEFYLTIVKEGQSPRIGGYKGFLRGLLPPAERKYRFQYLDMAAEELGTVTDQFMKNLQSFGARKLGVSKHDGVYYSDHMTFFSKVMNLDDRLYEMADNDLSVILANKEHHLGFNMMDIEDESGEKLVAMLTIKNNRDIPTRVLDYFMQIPLEFTLTQTFDFIDSKIAIQPFTPIIKATNLSSDKTMVKFAGLDEVFASDSDSLLDYGEQQTMLMVDGGTEDELTHHIEKVVETLSELGLVLVREDLGLENAYWGQLPSNFNFLKRLNTIHTNGTANFACLQISPTGKESGQWGSATSILPTVHGTPYFFDFFADGTGNTMIIGDDHGYVNSTSNFLISQAIRNNPRVAAINTDRGNEGIIKALNGKYLRLGHDGAEKLIINPFSLPRNNVNINFQIFWLSAILSLNSYQVNRDTQVLIKKCIDASNTAKPEATVTPLDIAGVLESSGAGDAAAIIKKWWQDFPHSGNETSKEFMETGQYYGFDLSNYVGNEQLLSPLLLFLMHSVNLSLDGQPTIVSLNNAAQILFEPAVSAIAMPWLESLKGRNAIVLLSLVNPSVTPDISIMRDVTARTSTRIFLQNSFPDENFADNFGLDSDELSLIQGLDGLKGEIYLKQGSINLALLLHLGNMKDVKSILASEINSLNMIEKIIASTGEDPKKWLPQYIKELSKSDESLF